MSCLLSLSATALSKRSSRHDSKTELGGATVSASDAAVLPPQQPSSRAPWPDERFARSQDWACR
jgi:hypothetical protein